MLLFSVGALICFIGTIWMFITALMSGKTTGEKVIWGLVTLFCQPLGGIIYVIVTRNGVIPLILIIIGLIMYGVGAATDPQIMRMMT